MNSALPPKRTRVSIQVRLGDPKARRDNATLRVVAQDGNYITPHAGFNALIERLGYLWAAELKCGLRVYDHRSRLRKDIIEVKRSMIPDENSVLVEAC